MRHSFEPFGVIQSCRPPLSESLTPTNVVDVNRRRWTAAGGGSLKTRANPRRFRHQRIAVKAVLVPLAGIEPALLAELDFESSASTNSATGASRAEHPEAARIIARNFAPSIAARRRFGFFGRAWGQEARGTFGSRPVKVLQGRAPGRDRIRMFKRLYDWTLSLAESRHSTLALAGIAFAESSFFPLPPDLILLPMSLAKPTRPGSTRPSAPRPRCSAAFWATPSARCSTTRSANRSSRSTAMARASACCANSTRIGAGPSSW